MRAGATGHDRGVEGRARRREGAPSRGPGGAGQARGPALVVVVQYEGMTNMVPPTPVVLVALAIFAASATPPAEAQSARNQALTCRFAYEQSIERSDLTSPRPVSRLMTEPTTYTLIFNRETRTGTYTRERKEFGTSAGPMVVLEANNRLSFYENVPSSDNMFLLTV